MAEKFNEHTGIRWEEDPDSGHVKWTIYDLKGPNRDELEIDFDKIYASGVFVPTGDPVDLNRKFGFTTFGRYCAWLERMGLNV